MSDIRTDNYLCVCQYGHSRSVALTRVLHSFGRPAVAAGWMTSGTGLIHLCEWATTICLLEPHFEAHIPHEHRSKIAVLNVGRDRWSNPYHPELHALLQKLVKDVLHISSK